MKNILFNKEKFRLTGENMAIHTIVWQTGKQSYTNGRQMIHMSHIEYNCLANGRQLIQIADKPHKWLTNNTYGWQTTQMADKRNLNPTNKKMFNP